MATLHVVLCRVSARADTGSTLPVPGSQGRADTVTTSGTSQIFSLTAEAGEVWDVTATGGNVWINCGDDTPVAGSGSGWLLIEGVTRNLAAEDVGEKLAYKTA